MPIDKVGNKWYYLPITQTMGGESMKQLLCFGDSNTWGLIPNTKQRYSWGVRWTSILQEKLNSH